MARKLTLYPWRIQSKHSDYYANNASRDIEIKYDLSDPLWLHIIRKTSLFSKSSYFGKYVFNQIYLNKINLSYFDILRLVENEIISIEDYYFESGSIHGNTELTNYNYNIEFDTSHFENQPLFQPRLNNVSFKRVIINKPIKRVLNFGTLHLCEYKEIKTI